LFLVAANMKRLLFKFYAPIILVGFTILTLWFVLSFKTKEDISLFVTVASGLIGFFYFIQKQQLEELELFKELFTEFNARYDKLNDSLNRIALEEPRKPLTEEEKATLNDYFNLCAEEFLFYRRGYIYDEVWRAWSNGMSFYVAHRRIGDKWKEEEKTDSYYGLKIK
jgi:hypothetical protein